MVLGCRDPYVIVLDGGDPYASVLDGGGPSSMVHGGRDQHTLLYLIVGKQCSIKTGTSYTVYID